MVVPRPSVGGAGVVFVGGFSYADVMDSAKGWAGTIRCNTRLSDAFKNFYGRCGVTTEDPVEPFA